MGELKPLLPLGNKTVIEQVVKTFLRAGVGDIRIVLGYRARDVIAVIKNLSVSWSVNTDFTSEMLTSVKMGINGLKHDANAFFVMPVDIPLVRPQTLRQLMGVLAKDASKMICPTFLGERGHPPLIPRQYAGELIHWAGPGGLKAFLERYDRISLDVPVFDAGILMDMDTPEQYGRIVARHVNRQIPLKTECLAMMATRFSENHPVVQHSRIVAQIARDIGKKLVKAGCPVNIDLIEACGYLHDICKGEKRHAKSGASLLKNMGFPNIADIIASHTDLPYADGGKITEREVLYLADKLVVGDQILPLHERLKSKLEQLYGHPIGIQAAERRIRTAMRIAKAIQKIIGR